MSQALEVHPAPRIETAGSGAAHGAVAGMRSVEVRIAIHEDLAAAAPTWCAFEREADGTVFQTYAWLSLWQRHIGAPLGVRPAIVEVEQGGATLALFALAVRHLGAVRELTWLGSALCDYNGPLLAREFSLRIDRARFCALWDEIVRRLQANARLRFDLVHLNRMPERIGAQHNPFLYLPCAVNPSGAYLTALGADWESFYRAKRSSATRRRDRTKRKRMADLGTVRFVTPADEDGARAALDTLMRQKARSFARMGVANLFARPGHADFYRALATDPATRPIVHVSRLDVGDTPAAVNLGLLHRGRYYYLLASYDDGDVSRFGPGAAHLRELMGYAIARGCRVFDFTIGDERYKREWCDIKITLYDHIAAATPRGALIAFLRAAGGRLKRCIKQTPILWEAATKIRSLTGALRARRDPRGRAG